MNRLLIATLIGLSVTVVSADAVLLYRRRHPSDAFGRIASHRNLLRSALDPC